MSVNYAKELEPAKTYSYTFFKTPKDTNLRVKVETVNDTFAGICALTNWTEHFIASPVTEERIQTLRDTYPLVVRLLVGIDHSLDCNNSEYHEQIEQDIQGLFTRVQMTWIKPKELKDPPSFEELTDIVSPAKILIHDFRSPLSILGMRIPDASDLDPINKTFLNLLKHLQKAENALTDEPFQSTRISSRNLFKLLDHYCDYLRKNDCSASIWTKPEDLPDFIFNGSWFWIEELIENIYQNELKIIEANPEYSDMDIYFGIKGKGRKRLMQVILDDSGPGFDEHTRKNGFTEGYSGFEKMGLKGNGVGMALITKVLQKYYGITVKAAEKPNTKRRHNVGGRLIITIPEAT